MKPYGAEIHGHILCNEMIWKKSLPLLMKLKEEGADLIVCTGGMSVDPDVRHRARQKYRSENRILWCSGTSGSDVPVILSGRWHTGNGTAGMCDVCKATVFDLVLPRIIAGIEVTKKDLAHMGNGGFCLGCKECHYPNCSFGKGV